MIARGYAGWGRQETPDARWQSFGVSLLATAALFAAALVAMESISPWRTASDRIERPEVVHLVPPTVVTPQRVATRPAPTTTRPAAPRSLPTSVPPVVATPSTAIPLTSTGPIVAAPSRGGADSSSGRAASAAPKPVTPPIATAARAGAPIDRAGFVLPPRIPNTSQSRDSIARSVMGNIAEMARTYVPTGAVKAELDASQAAAARLAYRSTTVGNAAGIHVMRRQGKDGDGAAGNPNGGVFSSGTGSGVSIPLPLFSSEPSAGQRKRDEAIDRDNRARFAVLAERAKQQRAATLAAARRDSIRLDSLRRDSLRADSARQAKAHAPVP